MDGSGEPPAHAPGCRPGSGRRRRPHLLPARLPAGLQGPGGGVSPPLQAGAGGAGLRLTALLGGTAGRSGRSGLLLGLRDTRGREGAQPGGRTAFRGATQAAPVRLDLSFGGNAAPPRPARRATELSGEKAPRAQSSACPQPPRGPRAQLSNAGPRRGAALHGPRLAPLSLNAASRRRGAYDSRRRRLTGSLRL